MSDSIMINGSNITKEKFIAYEDLRSDGIVNMYDISAVMDLAEVPLTRQEVVRIMKHYDELKQKFI